jgi:anthranilate/para-aminobenzoate synthase component I
LRDPFAALELGRATATRRALRRGTTTAADTDPGAALRALLAEVPPGGAIAGLVAYDLARPPRPGEPALLLIALAAERLEEFAPEPVADAEAFRAAARHAAADLQLAPHSSLSRDEHRRLLSKVQDHIGRGDIYQANLSQRFELPCPQGGLALLRALRRVSPAPFSGYFRHAGLELVSASPERLLLVDGREVSTRPIAGTRPRDADAARDSALAAELLLSEKERAEHLMLVDLARNDLGQVARTGSVHVDELMAVEDYAQVRHIVSNVRAELADGRDAFDALFALFPGGTITGVPKRRCMQILDALEPVPRGFYTGALFYATHSRLDANILIRSAVVEGGVARFSTGSGIVADSDPDFEYEETLHKAEGLRLALAAAGLEPM